MRTEACKGPPCKMRDPYITWELPYSKPGPKDPPKRSLQFLNELVAQVASGLPCHAVPATSAFTWVCQAQALRQDIGLMVPFSKRFWSVCSTTISALSCSLPWYCIYKLVQQQLCKRQHIGNEPHSDCCRASFRSGTQQVLRDVFRMARHVTCGQRFHLAESEC